MSARLHYVIFPTDYYDELIDKGNRAKAAALVEYYRDMKRRKKYKFVDYAMLWFGDASKKGTAHKWIAEFKDEIARFFSYWALQNEQHFLDAETEWKPHGNNEETFYTAQSPKNRDAKKSTETSRKPHGNICNKSKESNNISSPNAKRPNISEFDLKASNLLFAKLTIIHPSMKSPNFIKWAEHIKKMREIDGRTEEQIENMISLIFDDNPHFNGSFWRSNIRSTEKLRAQYDTIALQIKSRRKAA